MYWFCSVWTREVGEFSDRLRAFELYVLRGNQSGSEVDDWLQAEEEVRRAEEAMAVDWSPER